MDVFHQNFPTLLVFVTTMQRQWRIVPCSKSKIPVSSYQNTLQCLTEIVIKKIATAHNSNPQLQGFLDEMDSLDPWLKEFCKVPCLSSCCLTFTWNCWVTTSGNLGCNVTTMQVIPSSICLFHQAQGGLGNSESRYGGSNGLDKDKNWSSILTRSTFCWLSPGCFWVVDVHWCKMGFYSL